MREMLLQIYVGDLAAVSLFMHLGLLFWSVLTAAFPRVMRVAAGAVFALSVGVIIYSTVTSRTIHTSLVYLVPFSSFERAQENAELYRTMLMNVFFFLPIGASVAFLPKFSIGKRILLAVLVGFFLSVGVETAQYILQVGVAETDDVICNTLGAFWGSLTYPLSLLFRKITEKLFANKKKKPEQG